MDHIRSKLIMTTDHDYSKDPFPLNTSIRINDKRKFIELLKNNVNINQIDEFGETPITSSIMINGDIRWIRILLKKGADVNTLDSDGDSPLDLAKYKDRQDIVDLLLEFGAKGKEGVSVKREQDNMFYDDMSTINFIKNISKKNNG